MTQFSFVSLAAAVLVNGLSPVQLRAGTVEPLSLIHI